MYDVCIACFRCKCVLSFIQKLPITQEPKIFTFSTFGFGIGRQGEIEREREQQQLKILQSVCTNAFELIH